MRATGTDPIFVPLVPGASDNAEQWTSEGMVEALRAAADRYDRVAAVELYRCYEAARSAGGDSPDDRVVAAYRDALWRERPVARANGILPRPGTSYFGRERETARAVDALRAGPALVTVTGVAGVGKTRLALAAAERAREWFANDVRYVELHDGDDIAAAFARATNGNDLAVLLVVDDAGTICEAALPEIDAFRSTHPNSSVLVASRHRLGSAREIVIDLRPFALPLADAPPAVIVRTPAIAFFVERAALARPGFLYEDRFAPALAALCAKLDGLPLALELAAAQLRFFSLRELVERVDRLDFAPTSLEATLRGTLEQLDRDERRLFHRLAFFDTPWTMAEAEALCAGDGLSESEIVPAIVRLVDRSLLQTETRDEVVRYRFLETVRRVALTKGEPERERARARAVTWYSDAMLACGLAGIPSKLAMEQLDERHDGICSMLDRWCRDDDLALRSIVSTRKYWEWRGLAAESLARVEARAPASDDDAALAFAVARTVATHALAIGDNVRAERGVRRMRELAGASGDETASIEAAHNAAILAYNAGRLDETVSLLEQAHALQQALGMTIDCARTMMNLAAVDLARHEWDRAEERLAAIAHLDHAPNEAVFVSRNRAYAAAMRGELIAARAFAADAARRCAGSSVALEWRVEVEHVLGVIAQRSGDPYGALRHQQLALLTAPRLPLRLAALPLEHAALAAFEIGHHHEAAQLLGYVEAERARTGLRRSAAFDDDFARARAAISAALGPCAREHFAVGAALTPERAAEIAFSLPSAPLPAAKPRPAQLLDLLSEREREVAALIAKGATNREIAVSLCISVKTVENHLASIFGKLDVTRRSHVAVLVREGQLSELAGQR